MQMGARGPGERRGLMSGFKVRISGPKGWGDSRTKRAAGSAGPRLVADADGVHAAAAAAALVEAPRLGIEPPRILRASGGRQPRQQRQPHQPRL